MESIYKLRLNLSVPYLKHDELQEIVKNLQKKFTKIIKMKRLFYRGFETV